MLDIKELTKCYGEKRAVDDLSLHIAPGTIYGFIGHNGAGKTTTLKSVVGASSILTRARYALTAFPSRMIPSRARRYLPIFPITPICTNT